MQNQPTNLATSFKTFLMILSSKIYSLSMSNFSFTICERCCYYRLGCCAISFGNCDFPSCFGCKSAGTCLCCEGFGTCCKTMPDEKDGLCLCRSSNLECVTPKDCIKMYSQYCCFECFFGCTDTGYIAAPVKKIQVAEVTPIDNKLFVT